MSRNLCGDGELQLATLHFAADFFHILDDVVSTTVLDLLTLVACANRNDSGAAGNTCADAAGRVLEDETFLRVVTEALGREKKRVGSGLSCLETFVVSSDSHWRRRNADASHATVC